MVLETEDEIDCAPVVEQAEEFDNDGPAVPFHFVPHATKIGGSVIERYRAHAPNLASMGVLFSMDQCAR